MQVNIIKTNNPIQKKAEDLNKHFFFQRRHTEMAKKHMSRCSTFLSIREMKIKNTMEYHFTEVRMVIIKCLQTANAGMGMEKREPSYSVGDNVNWYSQCRE